MSDIRLVIAIPTTGMVRAAFAHSLAGMVGYVTNGIKTRPNEGVQLSIDVQESSVIHSNREQLVRRAIDNKNTHLMFLDDDMQFAPNIIDIMLGRRQPVVAVNYLMKKFPCEFVAVSPCGQRIVTQESSTGLQEIAYTGFGVSLFETRVFENTPQPWFQPEFVPASNSYTTEDNPCYRRIREAGFPCYVDHDASKLVKHIGGSLDWNWTMWKREEVTNANNS